MNAPDVSRERKILARKRCPRQNRRRQIAPMDPGNIPLMEYPAIKVRPVDVPLLLANIISPNSLEPGGQPTTHKAGSSKKLVERLSIGH